jgi:phosphoserine phosphatase
MGDAPMMSHSQGHAIAINPSPELEAVARRHGWHIELW